MRNTESKTIALTLATLLAVFVYSEFRIPNSALAQSTISFRDITKAAGITFVHTNGATGKKYLPETMGAGVAFLDYDGDGWQDLFFVNSRHWPARSRAEAASAAKAGRPAYPALYRNNGNGTFRDVTRAAGLAIETYGLGVATADYDNDGDADLFLSTLGQSRLFRNDGKGAFADVTKPAGLTGPNEFSTSAAWIDYDRDGHLDLFVANYVQWSIENDIYCTLDGRSKSYCTPESYKGMSARLWRNRGNGTFEDATRKAGLYDPTSKGLGIAVLDYDQDALPDLLLANDTQPNKLYRNNGNGTFVEKGVIAGVAFSEDGVARAGMGADAADYDRSGGPSIIIGNFSNQMMALYHNEGNGLFVDEAPQSELGRDTLLTLAFGCFFFDYDLDGWLDIFVSNGHIENEIERIQKRVTFAQPPHLFRNLGQKRFREMTTSVGRDLARPRVGRGSAYGDIDNDGDLDVVMTTNGGPPALFRNDGVTNRSLRLRLVGTKSNRGGLGAVATVIAGKNRQSQMLRSGSSYLSQSESILTFGLGSATSAAVEVRWPSGKVDKIANAAAGKTLTIEEGRGVVTK